MEISEKLLKFKFHIIVAFAFSLFVFFICYIAPSFLDVLKYFWPLFVSTALFLFAVVIFGRISTPVEAPEEKTGEGLLDYVAGETDQVHSLLGEAEVEGSIRTE